MKNKDKNFGFTFSSNNTKSIIEGLKNEKYDLGFCSKVENETSIDFIKVKQEELVIVVPKNHELSKYNEIDLIETISYNHIVFTKSSGLRQVIDNLFKQIDIRLYNVFPTYQLFDRLIQLFPHLSTQI